MNLMDLFVTIEVKDDSTAQIRNVRGEVERTGRVAEEAQGKTNKFGQSIGKGLATAAKIGAVAVSAIATAIAGLGKIAFDYNSQMEGYITNFGVMLGNTEKAVAKVESLKEMAAKTPFEMTDLASATQTLLAFNVANEETNSVLSKLGDISLGNSQKLESLVRAYGKMNAAQKVQLEDINMMIDAGFNPLLLVSEDLGLTMTEVYDKISKGEIAFSEITKAINTATSAGGQFYKGMEQASKTTQGLISTLTDNAKALVGEVFQPISDGLKNSLLPTALGYVEQLGEAFEEKGLEGLVGSIGGILGTLVSGIVNYAPKVIDGAIAVINSLARGLKENADKIATGAVQLIFAFIEGMASALPQIAELAMALVVALVQGIEGAGADSLIGTVVDMLIRVVEVLVAPEQVILITEAVIGVIKQVISAIVDAIPVLIRALSTSIVPSIIEVLIAELPSISVFGTELIYTLITGIIGALPELIASIPTIIFAIINGLVNNLDKLIESAPMILFAIIEGMIKKIEVFATFIPTLIEAIVNGFESFEWENVGENIVNGIKNGFTKGWNSFMGALSDLWDATLGKWFGWENPINPTSVRVEAQAGKAGSGLSQTSGSGWESVRNKTDALLFGGTYPTVGGLTSSYTAPAVTGTTFSGTTINVTVGDSSTPGEEIGEAVAFALQEMTNRRIAVYG